MSPRQFNTRRFEFLAIIIYSLVVIFSTTPAGIPLSGTVSLFYYLFIPGYTFTMLIDEEYKILWRIIYSVVIGIALIVSLSSLGHIFFGVASIKFDILLPIISMLLVVYLYFYKKRA